MPKILNPGVSEVSTCKGTLSTPNVKNIGNAFTKFHTHSTPNLWTFSHTICYTRKFKLLRYKSSKLQFHEKNQNFEALRLEYLLNTCKYHAKKFFLLFCDFENIKTGFRRFKILVLTVDIKSPIYITGNKIKELMYKYIHSKTFGSHSTMKCKYKKSILFKIV